jgi:riboflavin kinase/FMN adenylyltransferase
MDVVRGLERLPHSTASLFAVVGVLDGLHRGHEYLLRHLVAEAARRDARPVVVTFDHHPDEIITGSAPPLLCDPDERLELLAAAGVGTTVVVHFDQRLRETPFGVFVAMLSARAPLAGFLMTPDAAFGYRREGTPGALAELGRAQGFEVVVVPPFELDGRPVRSTEVRTAIAAGDLPLAATLLGRPHCVAGIAVAPATGQGSILRFPVPVALPPDGSYRVEVGPAHAGSPDEAVIDGGSLRIVRTSPIPWLRVAFLARA